MDDEINYLCELKIRHLLRIPLIFYKNYSAQVPLNNIHIPHISIKQDYSLQKNWSHFKIWIWMIIHSLNPTLGKGLFLKFELLWIWRRKTRNISSRLQTMVNTLYHLKGIREKSEKLMKDFESDIWNNNQNHLNYPFLGKRLTFEKTK